MAVNDRILTEMVERAADYFGRLESFEHDATVDNSKMVQAAAYAAQVFGNKWNREQIDKKLSENGIVTPMAVPIGMSSGIVESMCSMYADGERQFDRYTVQNARRVCTALTRYVKILEKEKEEKTFEGFRKLMTTGNF